METCHPLNVLMEGLPFYELYFEYFHIFNKDFDRNLEYFENLHLWRVRWAEHREASDLLEIYLEYELIFKKYHHFSYPKKPFVKKNFEK